MNPSDPNGFDQLAALFPEPKTMTIAGRQLVVREMPVRKIAKFAVLLAPVLARYPDGARFDSDAFFLAAGEAGIAGIAHAIDQPLEWVGELPPVQFGEVVMAVKEMNRDFFAAGVGLLVSVAMEMMLKRMEAVTTGLLPSESSSSTATETPAATH